VAMLMVGPPDPAGFTRRTVADLAAYVKVLRPGLSDYRALRLARITDHWANRYGVDAALMVTLIRQETYFDSVEACWPAPWLGRNARTCDRGLAQINDVWVQKWHLDRKRLLEDDWYNIWIQARVLSWTRLHYGDEPDWWGRYHSATPWRKAQYVAKIRSFLALMPPRR